MQRMMFISMLMLNWWDYVYRSQNEAAKLNAVHEQQADAKMLLIQITDCVLCHIDGCDDANFVYQCLHVKQKQKQQQQHRHLNVNSWIYYYDNVIS